MIWIVVFAFVVLAVIFDALLKLPLLKPELEEGSEFHEDPSLKPSNPELATDVRTGAQRSRLREVQSSPQSNPDLLASVAQFDLLPHSDYKYEVFLSFHGPDTHQGFTDCLYQALKGAGVCTFWDDERIRFGEKIISDNSQAIAESKIYVPILSRNYASSERCLQELTSMLQCKEKMKNMILPIFYNVTPTEVQDQTGEYGIALEKHDEEYGPEIVKQWKGALAEVCCLKGMDLAKSTNGYEGKLIMLTVSEVLSVLKRVQQIESGSSAGFDDSVEIVHVDDVVGIDDHVEYVKQLLQLGEKDVKILGIWGMGGIGKTTLATVIYNQIMNGFESCSFVGDIKEKSQSKGVEYLQSSLVADLLKCERPFFKNVDEGIHKLEDIYHGKKVLIVLDDVDDTKELDALVIRHESFGPGSRIIITTRNRYILEKVDCIYEARLMNEDAALKLFFKLAFGEDTPMDNLCGLGRRIVSQIGGLPLALQLVGSSLYGSEIVAWDGMLDKLESGSCGAIQDMLRKLIFEELNHEEKQIFLDIACFFIGEDVRNVSLVWKDQFPKIGIDALIAKSIIKIGDDHKVWMYGQLRDLGREIVRQENDKEPGKHSRLWRTEEAKYVLENDMGSSNVEAIRITNGDTEQCCFMSEQFRKLSGLRLLDLGADVHLVGDFKNLLPSLQWLRWRESSFGSFCNLHLPNMVSLELEGNDLRDDCRVWGSIKMMKLKVLNLKSSRELERTPDFSTFPHLERLILSHSSKLKLIDPSLAELKSLTFLDISFCSIIEELPENLGCLEKLEIFNASECISLARIPDSIGRLASLTDLTLDWTLIEKLPDSIESLLRLQRLSLRGCCNLKSLRSLSNLKLLKALDLYWCENLKDLEGIDQLNALESLDISYCYAVTTLPDLSNLKLLKDVCISGCGQLKEVVGLDQLYALERLDTSACCTLERLPNFALSEKLHSLKRLNISSCTEMERTPDLSILKQLEALRALGCRKLHEIMGLDELKALKILEISDCKEIEYLPDLSKLKQLKELYANDCEKLQDLVGLDGLESLVDLSISKCRLIEELPDLSRLKQLRRLDATGCEKLRKLVGLGELESLEDLSISNCKQMEEVPDLSRLKQLRQLNATGCEKLRELVGLGELETLVYLTISNCKAMEELPDLSRLKQLQQLNVTGCEKLRELVGLGELESLVDLSITNCKVMEDLPDLSRLKQLRHLDAIGCEKLRELVGLGELESLVDLSISDCKLMEELPDLSRLKQLRHLYAIGCEKLRKLVGLGELESLVDLLISNCKRIEELPDLSRLKQLQEVNATGCEKLRGLVGLGELESLKRLMISGCKEMENLPGLSKLIRTKEVIAKGCDKLEELEGLDQLNVSKSLDISLYATTKEVPNFWSKEKIVRETADVYEISDYTKLEKLEGLDQLAAHAIKKSPDFANS